MKMKFTKIISFLLLFCIILYSINKVLRVKNADGSYQTYMFYKQPKNSIDVLFLGSSRVHCDIDPAILYKEYGISSYNFSSGLQTLLFSYVRLKEALKTQRPKLIVLEGSMLSSDVFFYSDYNFLGSILGIRFSLDKINLIKLQIPRNRWNEFFNPFHIYHNRYQDLSISDFVKSDYYNFFKGLIINYNVTNLKTNNLAINEISYFE